MHPANRSMEPKMLFRKGMGYRYEHCAHPVAHLNPGPWRTPRGQRRGRFPLTDLPTNGARNDCRTAGDSAQLAASSAKGSSPPPQPSRSGRPASTSSVALAGSAGRPRGLGTKTGLPSRSDRSLLSTLPARCLR